MQRPSLGSNLCWGSTSRSLYSRLPEFKHIVGVMLAKSAQFQIIEDIFSNASKSANYFRTLPEHSNLCLDRNSPQMKSCLLSLIREEIKYTFKYTNIQIQIYIQCKINPFLVVSVLHLSRTALLMLAMLDWLTDQLSL